MDAAISGLCDSNGRSWDKFRCFRLPLGS